MKATDKRNRDVYVDYYRIGKGEVGRVSYDSETGEYVDGEVMSKSGQWCKYAVNMILRDNEQITPEEAEECIMGLSGRIPK